MICVCSMALAQEMPGMPPGFLDAMPKKAKAAPLDSDVPFLKCGTCRLMVEQAYEQTKAFMAERKPAPEKKRRLESRSDLGGLEESVETMLLGICDSEGPEGSWVREYDVFKADTALKLRHMGGPGKCRRECKTIDKACGLVMSTLEDHDLGETLIDAVREELSVAATASKVCSKMATVCKKGKVPKWPEGRVRKNEDFWELTEQDLNSEKAITEAKKQKGANGLPMTAVSLGDLDVDMFDDLQDKTVDPRDVLKDEL